jgi:hypothetical protein
MVRVGWRWGFGEHLSANVRSELLPTPNEAGKPIARLATLKLWSAGGAGGIKPRAEGAPGQLIAQLACVADRGEEERALLSDARLGGQYAHDKT